MTYHFLTLVNKNLSFNSLLAVTFIVLGLLLFNPRNINAQTTLSKIVIDAGHGGKDPGASGKYSREKDIVLAIALKTGQLIKERYPQVEIIYTRKTDVFISLKKRAEIANKSQADLFLSIHCNSNRSSQPHGSETYVMGLHKSEANLNVAKTENAAILFEDDYQAQYEGFDPTSDESHIIFNFFQNSFLSYNLDLASKMQSQFSVFTPLKDRGVKQAGFWVLYKTTMPGVLIEAGFLSNTNDEKFLNSKSGQLKLSQAISKAVSEYKDAHDASEKNKSNQQNVSNNSKSKEARPIIKE
ncbi:MAG: N-acetylmuramoyl-L-alanine amidase [Bacteroidales bacterium]|nr:N-acetylmuramoyl-L-alanine amidase [Bacteroidales bacterium]